MTSPYIRRTRPEAISGAYSFSDGATRPTYSGNQESERWRKSTDHESPMNDTVIQAHKAQQAEEKTRVELGKLVSVALKRLRGRQVPPSPFEAAQHSRTRREGLSLPATASAVRGAVRIAGGGSEWQRGAGYTGEDIDEEDDDGDDGRFSTEETFNNLTTIRDSLLMHGETLFVTGVGANLRSNPRVTRSSSPTSGKKDKVSSMMGKEDRNEVDNSSPASLLNELISILGEIVTEDCRYKVTRIRLKCPPYALQGVVLEVSSILARLHRKRPEILSKLGFAMLPAFSTFPFTLHERILRFFEEDIIKVMLYEYSQARKPQAGAVNFDVPLTRGSAVPEIQVERALEDSSKGKDLPFEPWSKAGDANSGATAWTAPRQNLVIYHLASLIAPLLTCMFGNYISMSRDIGSLHRFHSTLSTIVRLKEDAYADIVDVVAFASSTSRLAAVQALASFWPRSFGHLIFSRPLPVMSYPNQLFESKEATPPKVAGRPIHEFLLWRFVDQTLPTRNNTTPRGSLLHSATCLVCTKQIVGLGLMCACCNSTVHPRSCYDHEGGTNRLKYVPRDGGSEKITTVRYSRCQPSRRGAEPAVIRLERHHFETVHLFALHLCFLCKLPMWGCYSQGVRCSSCLHVAHIACVHSANPLSRCRSTPFTWKDVTINWDLLQKSWIDAYRSIMWQETELFQQSYEDVSIAYGILWMELELFNAALTSGALVIERATPQSMNPRARDRPMNNFELHYFVALYKTQLTGSRLNKSHSTIEYIENCGPLSNDLSLVHDMSLIVLAVSAAKLPHTDNPITEGFLSVEGQGDGDMEGELNHPYEIVTLAHIRDALGYDVGVASDFAAKFLMSHFMRLGLVARVDAIMESTPDYSDPLKVICVFPSALAIDASTSVEALFASIQACLEDLDLSINEFGLLLLVRRCWPSGMMTDYALTRLTSMVLAWILTEEHRMLDVVRDFVSVKIPMPGVRPVGEKPAWPEPIYNAAPREGSTGGAADYTTTRQKIATRFALPWLLQMHDLNRSLYAECLYQQCLQAAEAALFTSKAFIAHQDRSEERQADYDVEMADETLKYIVKLCQWGIVWTTFDDLFVNWLDTMSKLSRLETPVIFKHLPRLFSNDDLSGGRRSFVDDTENEDIARYMVDPWRVVVDAASDDMAGLERCLQWVLVLAHSGVEIPNSTLMQLSAFARDMNASFFTHSILVEALLYAVWVKSYGRGELLHLVYSIFGRQSSHIKQAISNRQRLEIVNDFLRHSLATCLLLYGCNRDTIRTLGLLKVAEMVSPPSRRRSNVPVEPKWTDPLSIDIDMLDLLSFAATEGTPETCVIAAKFLSTLVSESSLLGVDQVDQFVLINGHALCKCAWHFYSQTDILELNAVRLKLLLRLLIVDVQPFSNLLAETLHNDSPWEIRFEVTTRLFRVLLDINTPGLVIRGHQWRPSVVPVIVAFFSQLWRDNRVEVRLACDTLAKTLLPSHMDSMTLCFEEYLFKATLAERMALSGFLTLLHPILPSWQLISWNVLAQILREHNSRHQADVNEDTQDSFIPNAESETTTLQASLVNLALQMVADGSVANLHSLLQVKLSLVRLIGFQKCHEIKGRNINRIEFESLGLISQNTVVQSCFQGLMRALDTSVSCDLPPACMVDKADEGMVKSLLGSVLADVLIKVVHQVDFSVTPYLVSRSLLTSLVILLTKHDFSSLLLNSWVQHLYKAVYSVMQLLLKPNISFDIKQMIFSVGQAAIKQLQGDKKAATSIFHEYISVTTSVVVEHGVSSDHMLAVRGREFFENILIQFSSQRIYWVLFKFPCSPEFFAVLGQVLRDRIKASAENSTGQQGENMRDMVVREVLSMVLERRTPEEVIVPLKNLSLYVETVHHTGYPDALVLFLGSTLASMATQIAEWRPSNFDANHLLKICALVAQHHKAQSKDLLFQGEKYLRVALHRFNVDQASISQLLQISVTSHRRLSRMPGAPVAANHIPDALLDTANILLKGRVRQQAQTLTSLLETVCQSLAMKEGIFATESVLSAATEGLAYLQEHRTEGTYKDFDFTANLAIAKLMIQAINLDSRMMAIVTGQENGASVRVWALLLHAVITSFWSESGVVLWRTLGSFSQEYNKNIQRILVVPQNLASDVASIDINLATISVKLWLLLIQQICNKSALSTVMGHNMDREQCERVLWNEIWPGFERLLQRSVIVAEFDEYQAAVNAIVQSFIDIIHLLRHLQSSLILDSKLRIYLDQVKALKLSDSMTNKIARASEVLRGTTGDSSSTSPLKTIRRDFLAVEKIGWEVRRRAEEREARRHVREPTMG